MPPTLTETPKPNHFSTNSSNSGNDSNSHDTDDQCPPTPHSPLDNPHALVPSSPHQSPPVTSSAAAPAHPHPHPHAHTVHLITPASPNNSNIKETVIIFDWDDTLLASSFLSAHGYRLDSSLTQQTTTFNADEVDENNGNLALETAELQAQLRELEACVCNLLQQAIEVGQVHVITNAETGWVQLSAQKFMPAVFPLLDQVSVISARSTYEPHFPESPLKWKYFAMQERLATLFGSDGREHIEKHVLSFGDSHVEREAVRAVCRGIPNTRTKSVKFKERPSMEQLRRQLELVAQCFQYIHQHQGDLDLQLTVTVNPTTEGGENNTNANAESSSSSSSSSSSASTTTAPSSSSTPAVPQTPNSPIHSNDVKDEVVDPSSVYHNNNNNVPASPVKQSA